ncbi:hypothetical protein WJX72_004858 [[Myrmecia] bisecta]|uniref:FHA domain-containing protein n=1 Tax=[Myrmecia] bisecta TaxID=41462 RepID=A0AAW1PW55_9CHLO
MGQKQYQHFVLMAGSSYSKPGLQQLTVGRTRVSKLHIKDPSVSERHARISWNGEAWEVEDLGSSNGTLVNGSKLEGGGPAVTLKDGDVIQFGEESQLRVEITPVPNESVTVEEFLEAECHRLVQRLRGRAEQLANKLGADWAAEKAAMLACA